MKARELAGFALLLVAGTGAGFIGVRAVQARRAPEPRADYRPTLQRPDSVQLLLVYLGKARCSWSNQPQVPGLVEGAKLALQRQARESGYAFATIGIALDWRPELGLTHLAKLGQFDEIASGGSWNNALALRYVWGEFGGEPATPQIVILRREFSPSAGELSPSVPVVRERLQARKVGLYEIERWAESNFRLALRQ
jgi:hypothetical protein